MTKLQKQFVLKCLEKIQNLLSNEDLLQGAVLTFGRLGQDEAPRKFPEKFSDSNEWSTTEKDALSAAMLHAIALTSHELSSVRENLDQIDEATNLFLDKYIPLITAETTQGNRLESVKSNIDKIKSQVAKESEPHSNKKPNNNSVEHNPFLFFATAAALIGVAGGIAYALSNPKSH